MATISHCFAVQNTSTFTGKSLAASPSAAQNVKSGKRVVLCGTNPQMLQLKVDSIMKQLELKSHKLAALAAERAINFEAKQHTGNSGFNSYTERMSKWWDDHLEMRALSSMAFEVAEETKEEEFTYMTKGCPPVVEGRESGGCKIRNAIREFHYPRSDPRIFNRV